MFDEIVVKMGNDKIVVKKNKETGRIEIELENLATDIIATNCGIPGVIGPHITIKVDEEIKKIHEETLVFAYGDNPFNINKP